MYVYLLRHASEPRFKIGKANDIHQRLAGIGGARSFNLTDSLCLKLPSSEDAYRLEKILHRLFEQWNLDTDASNRYSGDTEQFKIECFERVKRFIQENIDLTCGSLPIPIPEAQETKKKIYHTTSCDECESQSFSMEEVHGDTLEKIGSVCRCFETGELFGGRWYSGNEKSEARLFLYAKPNFLESNKIHELMSADVVHPNYRGSGRIISHASTYGDESGCFAVLGFNANILTEWTPDKLQTIPENEREQIILMTAMVEKIPLIDDSMIFNLLEMYGVVSDVKKMWIDGLKNKMQRAYAFHLTDIFLSARKCDHDSIVYWVLFYCINGLRSLGMDDDSIAGIINAARDAAKVQVSKLKKEQDPVWGYFFYKNPPKL